MLAVGIVVVFILAFVAVVYLVLSGSSAGVHADGAVQILPAAGSAETADGQDTSFRSYSDELTKLEFSYLPHNEHHHLVSPGA